MIIINRDKAVINEIRQKLEENGGYCPCAVLKCEDTKCMCKDFRDKLEDPNFYGQCHCGLYEKIKDYR